MVVRGAELITQTLVLDRDAPIEEKVVEVEQCERAFSCHEGREDRGHFFDAVGAPRCVLAHDLDERRARVHDPRIERRERRFLRQALLSARNPQLAAHQVHQVCGVPVVQDAESVR